MENMLELMKEEQEVIDAPGKNLNFYNPLNFKKLTSLQVPANFYAQEEESIFRTSPSDIHLKKLFYEMFRLILDLEKLWRWWVLVERE